MTSKDKRRQERRPQKIPTRRHVALGSGLWPYKRLPSVEKFEMARYETRERTKVKRT